MKGVVEQTKSRNRRMAKNGRRVGKMWSEEQNDRDAEEQSVHAPSGTKATAKRWMKRGKKLRKNQMAWIAKWLGQDGTRQRQIQVDVGRKGIKQSNRGWKEDRKENVKKK